MFQRPYCLTFALLAIFGLQQPKAGGQDTGARLLPAATQQKSEAPGVVLRNWFDTTGGKAADGSFSPSDCGAVCGACGCGGCCACGEIPWSVWIWGAPSYSTNSFNSGFGGTEGAVVGCRMGGSLGLYGSIAFNHDNRSTQVLGTIGIQKFGYPNGAGLLDRSTIWVMWDQATDTGIDDLYLNQLRFTTGYMFDDRQEFGMTWSIPTSDTQGRNVLSPMGGPGYLTSAENYVGPYVRSRVGRTDITATFGYSRAASGVAGGLRAESRVTNRLHVFAEVKGADGASWAGSAGLAVPLGAADTTRY